MKINKALRSAAKKEGVSVGTLTRRILAEYTAKFGARFTASPFIQRECIAEWLAVRA
jgi:hypothetical protein